MKKMMIILLAATFAVSATAQDEQRRPNWENEPAEEVVNNGQPDSRYNNRNDYPYDNRYDRNNRYNDRYDYSRRELERKVSRLNRDYDYRIRQIENDFFMSRYRKERLIRDLENQRRYEIRRLYAQYSYNNNNRNCEPPRRNW